MIISFAKTLKEYESGIKCCTRRLWSDRQFKIVCKQWDEGKKVHDSWSKSPRNGGKLIGYHQWACRPYRQRLSEMKKSDVIDEGFPDMTVKEFIDTFFEGNVDQNPVIIWFRKL